MATATELLEDACDSGIRCLQDRDLLVAIAQALADSLGMTATELLQAACTSGIACLGSRDLMVAIAEGTNQNSGGGSGGGDDGGPGSPEGVQDGAVGKTWFNTSDNSFWVKTTALGTLTGWIQLIFA